MRHRIAFTLVEVLAAIAIIGILVALSLPAINSARESARRAECLNNVRQLGIANLAFVSNSRHFASGWQARTSTTTPGWGWSSRILPFIEQGPLSSEIEFQANLLDEVNAEPIKTLPTGFLCPSSPHNSPTIMLNTADAVNGSFVELGRSHYVGNIGSEAPDQVMADGEI